MFLIPALLLASERPRASLGSPFCVVSASHLFTLHRGVARPGRTAFLSEWSPVPDMPRHTECPRLQYSRRGFAPARLRFSSLVDFLRSLAVAVARRRRPRPRPSVLLQNPPRSGPPAPSVLQPSTPSFSSTARAKARRSTSPAGAIRWPCAPIAEPWAACSARWMPTW